MAKYRIYYNIDSKDGWAMGNHPTNIRICREDGSAPTENGLTMEDVGQEEWDKIQKRINQFLNKNIDWSSWQTGEEDYTIIETQ